jgi:hypothetical protein
MVDLDHWNGDAWSDQLGLWTYGGEPLDGHVLDGLLLWSHPLLSSDIDSQ